LQVEGQRTTKICSDYLTNLIKASYSNNCPMNIASAIRRAAVNADCARASGSSRTSIKARISVAALEILISGIGVLQGHRATLLIEEWGWRHLG
jgi:hypothetical protein